MEKQLRRDGLHLIAGVDESGRGPLAGPVVCAAVILPDKFRANGINDCKLVSPEKRIKLFDYITSKAIDYKIVSIHQCVIDKINILQASLLGMRVAIENLQSKPEIVLVDGNKEIPDLEIPQQALIKGDQRSLSIAAASILAKVARDRIMDLIDMECPQFNFRQNKGYGTRAHREALVKFGATVYHRQSFRLEDNEAYIQEQLLFEDERETEIRH